MSTIPKTPVYKNPCSWNAYGGAAPPHRGRAGAAGRRQGGAANDSAEGRELRRAAAIHGALRVAERAAAVHGGPFHIDVIIL